MEKNVQKQTKREKKTKTCKTEQKRVQKYENMQ